MILELQREEPQIFSEAAVAEPQEMLVEDVRQEITWGAYAIGEDIPGLTGQ